MTEMIIPVRCFTCGSLIADKWDEYKKRIDEGDDSSKVLDDLNVKRWCCRRMLISHIDLIEEFLPFT
jgi:DNA-directed RNA polymerase subunit N